MIIKKIKRIDGRYRFWNDEEYEEFFNLENQLIFSNDNDFIWFYGNFAEAAEHDRNNWMLIIEIGNSKSIKKYILRNVFGNYVTQTKKCQKIELLFILLGNLQGLPVSTTNVQRVKF